MQAAPALRQEQVEHADHGAEGEGVAEQLRGRVHAEGGTGVSLLAARCLHCAVRAAHTHCVAPQSHVVGRTHREQPVGGKHVGSHPHCPEVLV